uniref:PB1 domain-containing protein n=1 Tax=Heligmosomoides polygyrus TaxID=6339 RepID=A0A183GTV5_HELPZ
LAGKLTGRQLFLKDATLNLSDVALIEQSVEIDESLFDEVKSKFDSEWRRFSLTAGSPEVYSYDSFRALVEKLHHLESVPFTLCYNSVGGDLLPITNDEVEHLQFSISSLIRHCGCGDYYFHLQNLRKSFESARPTLRLLIQRKGESWEEKYGYGTDSDRRRKGLSALIPVQKAPRRNYSISNPEDFRQASAIPLLSIVLN